MSLQVTSSLELSGFEKACCVHGSWVTICHAAHLTGDHSIILKNIQHVIPRLLKRYPRMRSRLVVEGYRYLLDVLQYDEQYLKTDLFYSVVTSNERTWQTIAEDECNRNPYSEDGKSVFPLFHFKLLLDPSTQQSKDGIFHLLLFSNHCASDGRSGYIILNDFFNLVTSMDVSDRTEPINTEMLPCMTQMIPRPYGPLFPLIAWIWKRLYQHESSKLDHPRIPVKPIPLPTSSASCQHQLVKTTYLFASSMSTLYSRLHDRCRLAQVTLQGPLMLCLLLALEHCFPLKNKKQNRFLDPYSIGLAVDMRSRLPHSPLSSESVGFSISLCDVKLKKKVPVRSTSFWVLAKKCMRATNKVVTNRDTHASTHVYNRIISNEREYDRFSLCYPNGHSGEIALSNVGKYSFPCDYNQGQLKLRGLHVVNNSSLHYPTAVFYVTCAGDGQLDFSLAHAMESEEKANKLLNSYIRLLEASADASIEMTLQELLSAIES